MSLVEKQIAELPQSPGVYFFKKGRPDRPRGGQILYIGKATSLRSRVRSYWREDLARTRSEWIAKMIPEITSVEYLPTDSVLEALILESAQIKKHQPPYNIREKDGKSFLYVGITREDFPRVITFRGSELRGEQPDSLPPLREHFGPFPHGSELREALKIIRRIFPYRTTCVLGQGKPCFDAQIGLCPGVCAGSVTKQEYARTVRNLILFFQGKKSKLIKTLEREMSVFARALKFEEAEAVKKKIWALQHIQDVALIKRLPLDSARGETDTKLRFEAYDIAHLGGTNTVGVLVAMEGGEFDKNSYRRFKLKGKSANKSDDTGNLFEVLERRFNHHEWPLPNAIIVDGSTAQINLARHVLETRGVVLPVIGVVKDERHRAREVVGDEALVAAHRADIIRLNAEAHRFAVGYHRALRSII